MNTENKNKSDNKQIDWFGKFTIICATLAFSPVIIGILFSPLFYFLDCKGGAAGFSCNSPSFNNIAENIAALAGWGSFLTVPLFVVIWFIGFIGLIIYSISSSKNKNN